MIRKLNLDGINDASGGMIFEIGKQLSDQDTSALFDDNTRHFVVTNINHQTNGLPPVILPSDIGLGDAITNNNYFTLKEAAELDEKLNGEATVRILNPNGGRSFTVDEYKAFRKNLF